MATKKRRQPQPTLQSLISRMYSGMLTPQQQRAQARKDANVALQDQLRGLRLDYTRQRVQGLREQYAQGAYGDLLRGLGAEGSPEMEAIKRAYANAAGLNEGFAKGLVTSTTGQQAQNAAAGEQATEQLSGGTVGTMPSAGTNAQVLNYLASLPRGTFMAQAEAQAKGQGSMAV